MLSPSSSDITMEAVAVLNVKAPKGPSKKNAIPFGVATRSLSPAGTINWAPGDVEETLMPPTEMLHAVMLLASRAQLSQVVVMKPEKPLLSV
jgi:hypothetical protein